MWLLRGAQSAVFYYLSCTPCAEQAYKRKRKRDAARHYRRVSREGLVTDQPVFYQQAHPFTTNAYWSEEIALGPGPPKRRGHRKDSSGPGSQRNLNSPPQSADPQTPETLDTLDGALHSARKDHKNPLGIAWDRLRHQREDEVLWGVGHRVDYTSRSRTYTASSSTYQIARAPEIADYYSPVVSDPKSRAETRWMLQPPPSAKVMEGKARSDATRQSYRPRVRRNTSLITETPVTPADSQWLRRSPFASTGTHHAQKLISPGQISSDEVTTGPSKTSPTKKPALLPQTHILHSPSCPEALPTTCSTTRPSQHTKILKNVPISSPNSSPAISSLPEDTRLKVPAPVLLRKIATTFAEDRPSTNGTIDSGKAFHLQTLSAPMWPSATNHGKHNNFNNKPHFGTPLNIHFDDDSDADMSSDLDDVRHIRPYRWSMDI